MLHDPDVAEFHAGSVLAMQRLLHAGHVSESCLQHGRVLCCTWAAHLGQLSNDMPTAPAYALDMLAMLRQASDSGGGSGGDSGGFWVLVGRNVVHDQLKH